MKPQALDIPWNSKEKKHEALSIFGDSQRAVHFSVLQLSKQQTPWPVQA